jgi:glycosyltransferase involved in cell wall biosynthesis
VKILILTQYFPPETGAPQNRLYEMAVLLQKKGVDITILTAMPNYPQMKIYKGYENKGYFFEQINGLKVHRSWIYIPSSKSIFQRLLNYFSFVFSSMWVGTFKVKGKFDFVLCESPPLFLGISALWLKFVKRSALIFNVSDLWPESAEKLGLVKNKFFLKLSYWLESILYNNSKLISGQTQGICKNISERFPKSETYWLPNGADLSFYNSEVSVENWREKNSFSQDDLLFLYAGIIGHAQGLEVILQAAEKLRSDSRIKFILLGSGPEKNDLIKFKAGKNLQNVFFIDPVSKNEMPSILSDIDVALIPLRKLEIFKGAIPSKIFEALAMKKSILLGVEGEAKELFIDSGNCGLAFEPENENDLYLKIIYLSEHPEEIKRMGINGAEYVSKYFDRKKIADAFYERINSL